MAVRTMAYEKGRDAGYANSPISSNPYMSGTQAYRDWVAGWHRGFSMCMESLALDDVFTSY